MSQARTELPPNLMIGSVDGERIAVNIMGFVRLLRALGFKAGPAAATEAARALGMAGVSRRADFYWTLHALLVEREEQRPLFAQAFKLFWRRIDPELGDLELLASAQGMRTERPQSPLARRVDEAWRAAGQASGEPAEIEIDRAGTASAAETLARKDFEQMSGEEWRAARLTAHGLLRSLPPRLTRRHAQVARGEIDMRATVRRSLRFGGTPLELRRRRRQKRPPPLVTICDISGSMASYSRMFLHFMHGLGSTSSLRTASFVFGTRLTCIDRSMRHGDPDRAVELACAQVTDWSGGTRITQALHEYNRLWARRTLAHGAVVLLATDGLERGEDGELQGLAFELERLRKSCARLVWLNPLLRYDRYEALARGARAIQTWADETRSIHNLHSLAELGDALAGPTTARHAVH